MQGQLLAILRHEAFGSNNPIKSTRLAKRLEIPERMVRHLIRELIREGYPIGSRVRPPYGFYYIRSLDEKQEYAAQLRSRIHELFGRLYDLDRATAQAELTKQMEMF